METKKSRTQPVYRRGFRLGEKLKETKKEQGKQTLGLHKNRKKNDGSMTAETETF